jgi:serine/threonine protein kinase
MATYVLPHSRFPVWLYTKTPGATCCPCHPLVLLLLLLLLLQRWITFQLLHGLSQAHAHGVCHGDIKCENVMVTSWNWLFLTDFASYKPTYLPVDNPVSGCLIRCYGHAASTVCRACLQTTLLVASACWVLLMCC